MTLEWTDAAIRHLHAAHSYIREQNATAADEVVGRIVSTVDGLRGFPQIGRPGRVEGTRELVIRQTPFVVAYVVRPSAIRVLAILHGAQQWPASFAAGQPPDSPKTN